VHTLLHRFERSGLLTISTYGRGLPGNLILTEAEQHAAQQWQEDQADTGDSTAKQE
jgi:hypothetical protein